MKLAIIGSRTLTIDNLADYIPENVTEIVSGGAIGIDSDAAAFAEKNQLKFTLFLPQYEKYSRAAPLKRNEQIADYADCAIAFWDAAPRGPTMPSSSFKNGTNPSESSYSTEKTGKLNRRVPLFFCFIEKVSSNVPRQERTPSQIPLV